MNKSLSIRDAGEGDLAGILEIYNDAVAHTTAIWNDTLVDLENRRAWLALRQSQGFPVLVAVDGDGAVLGYASYGDWRPFDGYRYTVEHSVYVHKACRGAGAGRLLLAALIERARAAGKHVMVAGIDAANEASIALHEKQGFRRSGLIEQVGRKFDRWLDLVFMDKRL
ncbi:N-acetyltransferase family protein [Oleomonas cavernae]|uniref:N-acetyltransferase family protein n=1 Tax=Oleomonas cavernae TaxID=2320859 RepID=A0A418WII3_9PROT|nr:GNAT family N-acetyltransferase [Oleomonas cavernae]RJF89752.1 N-acetyltransferase family protein [Oleomonas cavernae]